MMLLVLVGGLGGFVLGEHTGSGLSDRGHRMPDGTYMKSSNTMHDSMAGMMSSLEGKRGDALDRAFLADMIVHHEGAVEMAKVVQKDGKHPELKSLADGIIAAQTTEIAQMQAWQKEWYPESAD